MKTDSYRSTLNNFQFGVILISVCHISLNFTAVKAVTTICELKQTAN